MTKAISLTAKFETGFQSFVPAICHSEMNPDQDANQTLIKKL